MPKERIPISHEAFRRNMKKAAEKSKKKCLLTDAEKVKNGTHKWVREGKTARLVQIEKKP